MFKSVIDFFKESTKKHPNKLALVFKNQKITYAELDNKSDIVMWYLLSKGVQKGQYVGILLERSIYIYYSCYVRGYESGSCLY